MDPLSSRILQQPELFIQLRHTSNQFQLQHPFAVQTPRNLGVPSANVACKRPGVPLSQHMNIGKKKQLCFVDVSGVDPLAPVCPVLPHVNADMLTKVSSFFPHFLFNLIGVENISFQTLFLILFFKKYLGSMWDLFDAFLIFSF